MLTRNNLDTEYEKQQLIWNKQLILELKWTKMSQLKIL